MQNKCPPKGPSEDFLSKENCVRGAFNQRLDYPAEGNGAGLVDPQQPKLTQKSTVEEKGANKR